MPILITFLAVLALLILIIGFRIHAFLALLIVALGAGMALGMNFTEAVSTVEKGVGGTLGGLALILGLGAMLGGIVADSGAAQVITDKLIDIAGPNRTTWALCLVGFVIGIPLFYTVGFVMMVPIIYAAGRRTGLPLPMLAVATVAALSVTHGFLPPHPAPLAITDIYDANLGKVLLYGLLLAIPAVLIAGPIFAKTLRNMKVFDPPQLFQEKIDEIENLPSFGASLFAALFPVLLIALAAFVGELLPAGNIFRETLSIIGNPTLALLLGVFLAIYLLGIRNGHSMKDLMNGLAEHVKPIAMIMLIIAGGGAFKQILVDSGTSVYIIETLSETQASPIFLAWGIAAALRIALGSATVAALTAAGIAQPLLAATSVSPELLVLATGAGSLTCSHVNDTGFWLFKEYFGLTVVQTLRSWTIMETIVSIVGLLGCLLLAGWV